jgi:flagellar hook protein FlgE
MLRSLFSGISGLRAHQTMLDVTGNNIANVNTAGFKSSMTVFEDTLSQLLQASGAPAGANGGTNPAQVGLGVKVAGITTNFAQGAAQTTGRATDLMIQGDGMFVVKADGQNMYTRSGSFNFDASGKLVTQDGATVQGWGATNGVVDASQPVSDITLPVGAILPPTTTTTGSIAGNLDAASAVGTVVASSVVTYDPQGTEHTIGYTFTKTAADTWTMTSAEGATTLGTSTLTFGPTGALSSASPVAVPTPWGGSMAVDATGLTQYGGVASSTVTGQGGGSAPGNLEGFTISPDGTLVGVFSNGLKQNLGQLALATFSNPAGLEKAGNSDYTTSANSGAAQVGIAGTGGRGKLASGTLEMSNVDLAQEFTNLIIAERGFQANSRVITTSDEILQDLVQLKR